MRYVIHFQATIEAGNKLDAGGGPGNFFGYLTERYKPEGAWVDTSRRQGWMVADITDPAAIAELMMVCTRTLGTYPIVTPVTTLQETAALAKTASENAKKAP